MHENNHTKADCDVEELMTLFHNVSQRAVVTNHALMLQRQMVRAMHT